MATAEEIKDGILRMVQSEAGNLNPEDLAIISKWALDLGQLTVTLGLATTEEEREAIRHEIQGDLAIIKNELVATLFQGGEFLKNILRGALGLLKGFLLSKVGPLLGPILSQINL